MKEKILELRKQGKSYSKIALELKCAKSTISYHLGDGQKQKTKLRNSKNYVNIKKANKQRSLFIREFVFRYKGFCKCVDCGINNPIVLDFDHKNPKEKLTNVATLVSEKYPLKIIKNEIRKCEIRCANCHRIKTFNNNGYCNNKYKKY